MNQVIHTECLSWLWSQIHANEPYADLIFIDPPFNTGNVQSIHGTSYKDSFDNYLEWLIMRVQASYHLLKSTGSFFIMLDWREIHYVKVELDKLFGRENYRNEIIWSFDYGGRPKNCWPKKHNTILWYTKSEQYTFQFDQIDRIPYMAPSLVGAEKAERGKTPTDVWWNTIVHTTGAERVDYPTQKPLSILERIIKVHTNPLDVVLDYFAGSGTTGHAAGNENRRFILVDESYDAIMCMRKRLDRFL